MFVNFPPFVFCMLFGIIKQIWHPCVVYNRNNSPSRGVSPSGYALGRHSSLGGVIPVVHHTGMSYLYNKTSVKNYTHTLVSNQVSVKIKKDYSPLMRLAIALRAKLIHCSLSLFWIARYVDFDTSTYVSSKLWKVILHQGHQFSV